MIQLYLSRLLLNPRSRQVQRETADPYNLHRTVMHAFPAKREHAGVLHRLEVHPRSGAIMLLVQSQAKPDWDYLTEKEYLLPDDPISDLENPAVKEFNFSPRIGQTLQFRLVANPTVKKVRRDDKGERKNSNRVPLVHEARQEEWLTKQAAANGFRLLDLTISQPNKQTGWQKDNGRSLTLYTVQFDGRLQITDAAKFQQALRTGIGPAKAFGCGLLSLAPG
jgi:CRISPR system Cascade subunit CasE